MPAKPQVADPAKPLGTKKSLQYVHARRPPAASAAAASPNREAERLRAENEALRKSYEEGKRLHSELQAALATAAKPRPDPELAGLRAENERLRKAYEDGRRQFAELKESALAARAAKPEPRKDSDRQLAAERDRKESELKAIVAAQARDLAAARHESETHRSARAAAERDAEPLRAKLAGSREILESVGRTLEVCANYHRKDPGGHMHAVLADARDHVRTFASTLRS